MAQDSDKLFLPSSEGIVIEVRVKPRSEAFNILISDEIVIYCVSPAEKGKANREILKKLSRLFKHKVRLISGQSSKKKLFLIESIRSQEAREILLACKH